VAARSTVFVYNPTMLLDGGEPAEVLAVAFEGHTAAVRLRLADSFQVTARCAGHLVPDIGAHLHARVTGPPL
jgi:hypothetical protein